MAAITPLTVNFDGTDGTSITTASQIGASQLTGGGTSKFDAAHAISGTAWAITCSNNNLIGVWPIGSSKANVWDEIYIVTPAALPGANLILAQLYGDSNTNLAISIRWLTDGSVQIRDNITAPTGATSSAGLLPPNTPVRIAFRSDPGATMRMKVYVGANEHGPITSGGADFDTGDLANTSTAATGVDTLRLGAITNLTGTMYFDRNRADDTTEPAPAVTVGPPTVDAGSDQTKDVGSGNFNITGNQTLVGGATVNTRAWTQDSGPTTLTLAGTTTATVTVTPPASSGTYVLRYTVTDSNGQVGFDTVSVSFVVPGTALVPIGDISNSGFVNQAGSSSNLYQAIDEVPVDTTDFITTGQSPSGSAYRCRVTPAVAPGNTTGCTLNPTLALSPDVTSYSVQYKVYDGDGTLKKTFAAITSGLSTTPTAVPLTFTPTEINSFAHWDSGIEIERIMTAS